MIRPQQLLGLAVLLLAPTGLWAGSDFALGWQLCPEDPYARQSTLESVDVNAIGNCTPYQQKLPNLTNQNFWLKQTFPATLSGQQVLSIANGFEDLAIYVDGKLVYSYGLFDRDYAKVASQQWHSLGIDPNWAGQSLMIRLHLSYSFTAKPQIPQIISAQELQKNIQLQSIATSAIVGLLLMMSLVSFSIAISALSFNVFAYFGCMALASANWIVFNQHSVIKKFITIDSHLQTYIDLLSLFIGSAALMVCAGTLLEAEGRVYKMLTRPSWIWAGFAGLFSLNPLLHLWYILPVYHILLLLTLPLLVKISVVKLWSGRTESRIFGTGSVFVMIGMVHDILQYAGIVSTQHASLSNFMVGLFFVFLTLALAVRYRRERLEAIQLRDNLLRDIQSLNENLESHVRKVDALVDAKTRDIRSIMQHIEIGICLVESDSLLVNPDYSRYTEKLFERKALSGQNILQLLEDSSSLEPVERSTLERSLAVLSGASKADFDFHEPSLPNRLLLQKSEQGQREIDLSWHPIYGHEGDLQRWLLTLTDMTVIRRLEKSSREKARELEHLNRYISEHVLQRFFPPDLVQDLVEGRAAFDDKPKQLEITVLLADLSNFTMATELLGPEGISSILNSYFIKMTDIIFSEGGTIDKFMGDGILVLFGAPREMPPEEQVQCACRCALKMQSALVELNDQWNLAGLEPFKLRIAISHGPAIVGSFGGQKRSDFTAIGSTMNLAARISMSAQKGEILLSASAASFLAETELQSRGYFKLKGVSSECELYSYQPKAA